MFIECYEDKRIVSLKNSQGREVTVVLDGGTKLCGIVLSINEASGEVFMSVLGVRGNPQRKGGEVQQEKKEVVVSIGHINQVI